MMTDNFYRAFEDRMRGTRDLILSRLEIYSPLLRAMRERLAIQTAVDLGCGRGEWLEILQRGGFRARGVDLDDQMLQACRERGLDTVRSDAIAFLKQLESASVGVVSAFHVAEHLPLDQLREMLSQARRVLVPGGLLILETPNPENLLVGSNFFYLDPTHLRPLPRDLLAFLAEHSGLTDIAAIRLNGDPSLLEREAITLKDVLAGVSPDYAVIAQLPGNEPALQALTSFLSTIRGLSLDDLTTRFEQRLSRRLEEGVTRAQNAETQAQMSAERAQQAEVRAQQAEQRAQLAEAGAQLAEARAQQAEARAQQAEARAQGAEFRSDLFAGEVKAFKDRLLLSEDRADSAERAWREMEQSISMKVTRPLRWFRSMWRRMASSSR